MPYDKLQAENSAVPTIASTAPTTVTAGTAYRYVAGVRYTVTVIPYDGSPATQIGSGSTTTASSLAISGVTFDPTMLANGDYKIEIKATDTDDNVTTTFDQHVSVSGHLKLGRETLSVTDLTIPVAGIPLTIVRSYDSLNAGKSGDFGYGWSLSYGDAQLEVDLAPGSDIGWGGYPAFLDGTRVYVTMPGGEREGFTFQPYQESVDSLGLINYWHPYFAPDPGVTDTLTAPDALLQKDPDSGEYYSVTDSGIDTYNPEDPNYGGTYTVTNLQGLGSTIDATTGKLLSMQARNGNTLTFSDTAITSNTGRKVVIARDPEGRITAIEDPNNNSVKYAYDVNGNLISVTDRMNNPPTTYQYNDPNHAHYLTAVLDPLGVQQLQVSYGSDGRMSQMKDAAQDALNFAYDTTNLTESITDPNLSPGAQTATVDFDKRGNVLQTTDPTGAVSTATYNNPSSDPAAKDLPDSITQVKRNPDNTTTSYTTQLSYDDKGEVTSTTDPLGAVTHTTYGPFGEVVTSSDGLGNTTTNSYDNNGNLLSTMSAAGVATYFSYDAHNNLTVFD